MEFNRIWVLRGPNVWSRRPVLEAEINFGDLRAALPSAIPDFTDRLLAILAPHADAALIATLEQAPHLGSVLQHLALFLQHQASCPVSFGTFQEHYRDDLSRVIVEFEEEKLGQTALEGARDLCVAARDGGLFDVPAIAEKLRHIGHEVRLGPSGGSLVTAAKARGIPYRRLGEGSLCVFGWGARQRRALTAETDRTGAIAQYVAQDKHLTRALLQAVGVPVPEGRPVSDAEDAWRAAGEIGGPVVVKPQYGNQGRGVATDLRTREQVEKAYAAAREESSYIMVERFVPGEDHRLLVVGNKVVAASRREPAQVQGDGKSTIRELVAQVNTDPRRSDGHSTSLSWIKLDAVGLEVIAEQSFTPDSVPPDGLKVLIRRNGNLSTGGTATDVTDDVHPDVAARAVEAAQVVGLDVAGVDVVAVDISRPMAEQGAAMVEVNAGPGLRMHLDPSAGRPRPVGEAILGELYPPGQTGRIPLAAVTGVNGKTTTSRLLAHILKAAGRVVGMACTDGIYIDGRRTETRDCAGPYSARSILLNPKVEAAVLETARGGILREGLGFDQCAVGVVTNIGHGDHFGLRGIDTLEGLAQVKRVVVEAVAPDGTAVLNAEDPLVAAMSDYCPGRVLFFSKDANTSILSRHKAAGERAVAVRNGQIILIDQAGETSIAPLDEVPLTQTGGVAFQLENALAATGAAIALGLPIAAIRTGLATFMGDAEQAPARFNIFRADGAVVIVDYAHNPSAVTALVDSLDQFPAERRVLVFSGCNRRDQDLIEMGQSIGKTIDRVILYRDWGHSGRADGELNEWLRRGMARGGRTREIVETITEMEAIEQALSERRPGDLIVLGIESIEESLALVSTRLTPV